MSGSMGGCGNGVMVRLLRHRQTKGAVTDRPNLRPPRHILTLPKAAIRLRSNRTLSVRSDADYHRISIAIDSPFCFFSSSFGALKVSIYLRYRTPDLMQDVNYQGEFSFHNVELPWLLPLQVYWANEVLWSLAVLGGLALPCFVLTSRRVRRWLWAWEVPVPPWISQAFFFSAALIPRDRAVLDQFQHNNMPSELREFAIAVGVAIWLLVKFMEPKRRQQRSIHVQT